MYSVNVVAQRIASVNNTAPLYTITFLFRVEVQTELEVCWRNASRAGGWPHLKTIISRGSPGCSPSVTLHNSTTFQDSFPRNTHFEGLTPRNFVLSSAKPSEMRTDAYARGILFRVGGSVSMVTNNQNGATCASARAALQCMT